MIKHICDLCGNEQTLSADRIDWLDKLSNQYAPLGDLCADCYDIIVNLEKDTRKQQRTELEKIIIDKADQLRKSK